MRNRIVIFVALVLVANTILRSQILAAPAGTVLSSMLLLSLCGLPAILWVRNGMKTIPLFEIYALVHFTYYWSPAFRRDSPIWAMEEAEQERLLLAICTYLGAATIVYFYGVGKGASSRISQFRVWNREIEVAKSNLVFWAGFVLWLLFQLLMLTGLLPNVGGAFGTIRAISTVAGTIAIFYFSSRFGAGDMTFGEKIPFVACVIIGILFSCATGFLVGGVTTVASALFGFAVGGKRIPIFAATAALVFFNFLHLGKAAVRERYWVEGGQGNASSANLFVLYDFWFTESWRNLWTPKENEDDQSLLARTSLVQMLSVVMTQSPSQLPFLNGESYTEGVKLLVPSFLWKGRPDIHHSMQAIGLYYGIHTEESMQVTSISFGQIGEAWANFGWFGLVLEGAYFGWFFSVGANITGVRGQRSMNTMGFLFGMVFCGWAVNVEHSWGAMMMAFWQTAVVSFAGLYKISSPPVPAPVGIQMPKVPRPIGEPKTAAGK